ncbi:hypothetical protein DFH06DRAFT_1397510 [Mycena polygramma]|nr:hypothetical protein DFH06DRAFT_1397510 [Mycena polygramma]
MILHHQIAYRFSSLCLDESWVTDRKVNLVRTQIRILKDLPPGLTRDVDEVVDILPAVLRISNSSFDFTSNLNNHVPNQKLVNLNGFFCAELQNPNPVIRDASQTCIALLVKLSGRSAYSLLEPHHDHMLGGIYTKPLRALPFPIQIGMIEAVRYCVTLDPPLVELNDQLLRVFYKPNLLQTFNANLPREHYRLLRLARSFLDNEKRTVLASSSRIDLVFEIVGIYPRNLGMDLVRTTRFLYKHVALSSDVLFQRNILMRFLTWLDDPSYTLSHKMFFRYIVTPILLIQAHRPDTKDQLLDVSFINRLARLVWHPSPDPNLDDRFKIEILYLTTVLVQHYPALLEDAKEIIRSAWQFISNEDTIVKQTGFLLTARSFVAFPTPPKFLVKTRLGLLRTPSTDGHPIIRQEALATLVPCLAVSDPTWASKARQLLTEEGFSQSLTIYHLIVKHSARFYSVRDLFVSHMVNSLNKLGMSTSSTPHSRVLSIEILNVILKWEEQTTQTLATGSASSSWTTPLTYHENTDVAFGLRFFLKTLEQNELNSELFITQAIASAKMLQRTTAKQEDSWYITNAEVLRKLVRKGIVTDEYALHDALHPIFAHLMRLFPLPKNDDKQQDDRSEFHTFVHSAITDGLRNTTILHVSLEKIDPYASNLMKLLGKLAKDHVDPIPASNGFEMRVRLIVTILNISQLSVGFLVDQRRWLLSTLVMLVEKSKSGTVCNYILDLAKSWALVKQDAYPTMKERASLLQKMVAFESRTESIYHSYLEVIHQIYTKPALRRSDLTTKFEQSFLLSCRTKDPELQEKIMDLLDASVPRSLIDRWIYIFGVQRDTLAEHNWIYLALHLLLNTAEIDVPISHERRMSSIISIPRPATQTVVQPIQRLLFLDSQAAHDTWISVFPAA